MKPKPFKPKPLECIRKRDTSWILCNSSNSHKEQLNELEVLPLSYYFELQDLLMLILVLKGNSNIKIPIN